MKCLFNVWARSGHLNPNFGVAHRLLELGHEVAFCCYDDAPRIQERLRQAGMNVDCLGPPETDDLVRSRSPAFSRLELTKRMRNSAWRLKYFEAVLVSRAKAQIPSIRESIRKFGPDVVCNEGFSYGGAIAAQLEGVRWASIVSTLDYNASPESYRCDLRDTVLGLESARRELAKAFGTHLDFQWMCAVSPYLNLAFSIPELTPQASILPRNTHFVGPVHPFRRGDETPFPWDWLESSRPLVYISDGTELRFDPEVANQLARISVDAGAQVVITDGEMDEDVAADSSRILRVRYAPQLQLLQRSSLFVTHGGANSIVEGIASGVPLLVLPIGFDQQFNACCVRHFGSARVHDPWNLDLPNCERDIRELLQGEANEVRFARTFREKLRARDGCRTGAALLESLAVRGERNGNREHSQTCR